MFLDYVILKRPLGVWLLFMVSVLYGGLVGIFAFFFWPLSFDSVISFLVTVIPLIMAVLLMVLGIGLLLLNNRVRQASCIVLGVVVIIVLFTILSSLSHLDDSHAILQKHSVWFFTDMVRLSYIYLFISSITLHYLMRKKTKVFFNKV